MGLCERELEAPLRKIFWIAQRMIRVPFHLMVDENARKNPVLRIRFFWLNFMMLFKAYDVEEYWMQRGKFYYKVEESKRKEKPDLTEGLLLRAVGS